MIIQVSPALSQRIIYPACVTTTVNVDAICYPRFSHVEFKKAFWLFILKKMPKLLDTYILFYVRYIETCLHFYIIWFATISRPVQRQVMFVTTQELHHARRSRTLATPDITPSHPVFLDNLTRLTAMSEPSTNLSIHLPLTVVILVIIIILVQKRVNDSKRVYKKYVIYEILQNIFVNFSISISFILQ